MMQYFAPDELSERKIVQAVEGGTTIERIDAVLSAIYFCQTQFAGEILLQAMRTEQGQFGIPLLRIAETYMQIHRTNFLHAEFIQQMEQRKTAGIGADAEINELIEGVRELAEIHSGGAE